MNAEAPTKVVVSASNQNHDVLKVAVVIPCYGVAEQVLDVLAAIPERVDRIFCVDDACPQQSGDVIERDCRDPRVKVLRHSANRGVGGAMVTGYQASLEEEMDIIVKIDGDGQMDPSIMSRFVQVLAAGEADYCKGNRFYRVTTLKGMPKSRVIGNALLSFASKLSSGYWQIFDPNNGYTAIHAAALRLLPMEMLDRRFFFESDMLFRLNTIRAVVRDIPMSAVYRQETSNLKISRIIVPFTARHIRNFAKRIIYNYYVRDFHLASVELVFGAILFLFGAIFGLYHWLGFGHQEEFASAGTVMLAALPVLIGLQLLLSAISFDIQNVPQTPLQRLLRDENPVKTL